MNEKMKENREKEKSQDQKDKELYEEWMKDHPEEIISKEALRDCEPDVMEFEALIAAFENEHSLEELLKITDLTSEDAPNHPIREPAKQALAPIVAKLNILKKETNISTERHEELKAEYKRLSRAVGIINNNRVDHNR